MQEVLHSQTLKGETSMKRFLMALALAFLLSASTLAGDIPCDSTAPSPPAAPATSAPSPGDIPTAGFAEEASNAALDGLIGLVGLLT